MTKRVSDDQKRQNAERGAITRWCPSCKRKNALSSWPRLKCRYCGYEWRGTNGEKMQIYKAEQNDNFGTALHFKFKLGNYKR
jgi:hypothetical protein